MYHDIIITNAQTDFSPASESSEIIQNVITICSTIKGTVPLDRDFGVEGATDIPENIARAKLSAGYIDAVRKLEPRAEIISVKFQPSSFGELLPVIRINIAD